MLGSPPAATTEPAAAAAVAALRSGALVALPTETVYGLAADATDPVAVARIYALKGRPADHPLILHVASPGDIEPWVRDVPHWARQLTQAAWPGPLTVVLRRSDQVGDWVTGGQDTVAIRVPDHSLTRQILAQFGRAVAAPSANRFGQVSPTSADHVRRDLAGLLDDARDVVIDGGDCPVGVESTIVDCTGPAPVVLRPGRFSAADVSRMAGVGTAHSVPGAAARVAGSLASHYSPEARVHVVAAAATATMTASAAAAGLIATQDVPTPTGMVRLMAPVDSQDYARRLFWALREADSLRLEQVFAVPPSGDDGLAAAVRDRLHRAATPAPGASGHIRG